MPAGAQKFFGSLTQNSSPQAIAATAQELRQFSHDRGYSARIRFDPTRFLFTEVGYDHSLRLHQDSATLTVGVDLKSLFSKPTVRH